MLQRVWRLLFSILQSAELAWTVVPEQVDSRLILYQKTASKKPKHVHVSDCSFSAQT